jgi:hypothetical protein
MEYKEYIEKEHKKNIKIIHIKNAIRSKRRYNSVR